MEQNPNNTKEDIFDQPPKNPDMTKKEPTMEFEEVLENDVHLNLDSDADTFNNSTNNPIQLEHIDRQFIHHGHAVLALAVNPAKRSEFASGGMDDQIALWSTSQETPETKLTYNETINNLSFSFDGSLLAASILDNTIKVLKKTELSTFEEIFDFNLFTEEVSVC